MEDLDIKTLQQLCRKKLKSIADKYPDITKEEVIQYYDFMAIQCIDEKSKAQSRILGMCLITNKYLEI